MIKVGIIGGGGYTAGELIRLLVAHPKAELVSIMSNSHISKKIYEAHPDLIGETDLVFESELKDDVELVFICSGHGKSKEILASGIIPTQAKIIDLSTDFRYKEDHGFIYGLPELKRKQIRTADYVANPGCFATCIQLCLIPLAAAKNLNNDIHISAITGSTGAGQKPTANTHFSWRSNNASIYKAFKHQHLVEVSHSIIELQHSFNQSIHFIPFRGAFTRGIIAACYMHTSLTLEEATHLFSTYYAHHPFIIISEKAVDVKQVVNSNKCIIHLQKEGHQLLITGVIDNLLKGASGQAIQNMNLMFAMDESLGLKLKGSAF
ncbi:N-acetyl-gamma-glutamyl-phosphate reductase [Balneola vulgaris]|jgi:N-acetyl-gamma-glutamyl-phosphate reductase|uniref:N-acetyl-gamma-glutamyl-phosphate reductase n=1 Tax=Balneola vulgaris TaxID=287535 RepID=UPI000380C29F|nr:N-acetyl-gamma-glutamyl-phosphate reductase [Balneola vulgaris]